MIPSSQPINSVTSSANPGSNPPAAPETNKTDLFAPAIIMQTYMDYTKIHKHEGTMMCMTWLIARNFSAAKDHKLNTEDDKPLSKEECIELLPKFEQGVNQCLSDLQQSRQELTRLEGQGKIKLPENTFKLIKAIFGGEEKYNKLPTLSLDSEYQQVPLFKGSRRTQVIGGGYLHRYQESLKSWQLSQYHDQESSPTIVSEEHVKSPFMKGIDRTRKPFFVIKAVDTENMKEYVQVFYQAVESCAWYTEGEKIIDCNYLVDDQGLLGDISSDRTNPITSLSELIKNGEIPKTRHRRSFPTAEEIAKLEKNGDFEKYMQHFDLAKYKWVCIQPEMT